MLLQRPGKKLQFTWIFHLFSNCAAAASWSTKESYNLFEFSILLLTWELSNWSPNHCFDPGQLEPHLIPQNMSGPSILPSTWELSALQSRAVPGLSRVETLRGSAVEPPQTSRLVHPPPPSQPPSKPRAAAASSCVKEPSQSASNLQQKLFQVLTIGQEWFASASENQELEKQCSHRPGRGILKKVASFLVTYWFAISHRSPTNCFAFWHVCIFEKCRSACGSLDFSEDISRLEHLQQNLSQMQTIRQSLFQLPITSWKI